MILVDSDILIAHLRGLEQATAWLRDARTRTGQLGTSVVSLVEITCGMRSSERSEVWRLLDTLAVRDVDESVARRAGELQRTHRQPHPGIGLADYLIAATADVGGLELATLNVKHFPMFKRLRAPFEVPD